MKKIATKYFCAIRSVEKQPKTDGNFRYTDRPPFYHSFSDKISFLLMQGWEMGLNMTDTNGCGLKSGHQDLKLGSFSASGRAVAGMCFFRYSLLRSGSGGGNNNRIVQGIWMLEFIALRVRTEFCCCIRVSKI